MCSAEESEVDLDLTQHGSSFYDWMRLAHDAILPRFQVAESISSSTPPLAPHGTTILALKYEAGVIIAADRQATEGYQIASRHIEKVHKGQRDHAWKWSGYFKSSWSITKNSKVKC
jgi:hypothetical protein